MNQFNLGHLINRFINKSLNNLAGREGSNRAGANADIKFQVAKNILNQQSSIQQSVIQHTANLNNSLLQNLKMNSLAAKQNSLYLKDLMNLPKEIKEILVVLQNANNAAAAKDVSKLLTANINLANLAELIQINGKQAVNKLVAAMAEASKQGITDLSQLKEAVKFINASVSVAGQDNPAQLLKNFMLLYLPWLPLQEGVDFDLEIESSEEQASGSDMTITVMISTINYGNVKVLLILHGLNSIDIFVNCCDKFPKEELIKHINDESKAHSIQSQVSFEQNKATQQEEITSRQAKVNVSTLKEVNPFLLLMVNAVIRNTIELDNQAVFVKNED